MSDILYTATIDLSFDDQAQADTLRLQALDTGMRVQMLGDDSMLVTGTQQQMDDYALGELGADQVLYLAAGGTNRVPSSYTAVISY
jgi:hypothetical protein